MFVYFSISACSLDLYQELVVSNRYHLTDLRKRNLVEGYPVTLRTGRQKSSTERWRREEAKELFVGRNSMIRIINESFLSFVLIPCKISSRFRLFG